MFLVQNKMLEMLGLVFFLFVNFAVSPFMYGGWQWKRRQTPPVKTFKKLSLNVIPFFHAFPTLSCPDFPCYTFSKSNPCSPFPATYISSEATNPTPFLPSPPLPFERPFQNLPPPSSPPPFRIYSSGYNGGGLALAVQLSKNGQLKI